MFDPYLYCTRSGRAPVGLAAAGKPLLVVKSFAAPDDFMQLGEEVTLPTHPANAPRQSIGGGLAQKRRCKQTPKTHTRALHIVLIRVCLFTEVAPALTLR